MTIIYLINLKVWVWNSKNLHLKKNEYLIYPTLKDTKSGEIKLQDIYNYFESEEKSTTKKMAKLYRESN